MSARFCSKMLFITADLEARTLKDSSPLAKPASPMASAKQRGKKPVPLPRTKKTPQARHDLDIYENIGPIKQEEGADVSLDEYHQMVCSTPKVKLSRSVSTGGLHGEEDTTGNTGDSGIGEWIGKCDCVMWSCDISWEEHEIDTRTMLAT